MALLARAAWRLPPPPPLLSPEPTSVAVHGAMRAALCKLDLRRSLVVDAGCGFGSFAQRMAQLAAARELSNTGDADAWAVGSRAQSDLGALQPRPPCSATSWNVLGIDLQPSAIARARAAAHREGLDDRRAALLDLPDVPVLHTAFCSVQPRHVWRCSIQYQQVCKERRRGGVHSQTQCRLAYTEMEAATVFAWLQEHYPGDIVLLHVGFPTPFPVRSTQGEAVPPAATGGDDAAERPETSLLTSCRAARDEHSGSHPDLPAVHGKPAFLVQVRNQTVCLAGGPVQPARPRRRPAACCLPNGRTPFLLSFSIADGLQSMVTECACLTCSRLGRRETS